MEWDERGLVWYTNFQSRKGQHVAENPYAAATFWWGPLERSIRLEGTVAKCSDAESDARYATRPRRAKLNHYAQQQSQPCESHEAIEKRFAEVEREW